METMNKLFETFQECVARGEKASLFLETRNGSQHANFSVKLPVCKPGKVTPRPKTSKSPSTVRRDQQRLDTFMQRKRSRESWSPPAATSTPAKEESLPDFASCSQSSVETTTTVEEIVEEAQSKGQDLENEENIASVDDKNEKDKDKPDKSDADEILNDDNASDENGEEHLLKKDFELISSMLKEINNKILKKTELESRSSVNKGHTK